MFLHTVQTRRYRPFLALLMLMAWAVTSSAQETALPVSARTTGEEAEILTLPDALSLALRQNPALAEFTWEARAADAMIEQAGRRPNPELSVEIEEVRLNAGPSERTKSTALSGTLNPLGVPSIAWDREQVQGAGSGFSESELTITIAQPIELGRKRAKRVTLAEREKNLLLWDYQAARADVLAKTASDFVEVLAAQERVALEQELVELAEEIVRTISFRVEAGQVSPLELARAEVAMVTTRIIHEESLKALEAARAVLASNWGEKRASFTRAAGRLDERTPLPALEEMEALIDRNPDLARWAAELEARRATYALERARRLPDPTVELGLRNTGLGRAHGSQFGFGTAGDVGFSRSTSRFDSNRTTSFVLGFSIPLPLFDRNRGNIAAAEAMVSKVSLQRRTAETAVFSELAAAHQMASSAFLKARRLQDEVMPKIQETFEKIQRGYRQGKFSYLEVLDTQRTLFDARETFLDALRQYHQGVVRMERLTGQALAEHGPKAELDTETTIHEN